MCIIAIKSETEDIEQWEKWIDNMQSGNKDGMGYGVSRKGEVYWEKGITKDELKAAVRENIGMNMVLHFRAASSGPVNAEMCHPFVISSNPKRITRTQGILGKHELLLFHNGVIFGLGNQEKSDTLRFTELLSENAIAYANNPGHLMTLIGTLSTSKYVLISSTGNIFFMSSDFQTEKDTKGVAHEFSNYGFRTTTVWSSNFERKEGTIQRWDYKEKKWKTYKYENGKEILIKTESYWGGYDY